MSSASSFLEKIEVLPGRLYFCTVPHVSPAVTESGQPSYAIQNQSSKYIYFCTDASLTYTAFFADFGPLNIGLTYKFCEQLDTYLTQSQVEERPVIYYCSQHPHYRANSAVLICAYLIFVMGMTVEQAYAPFIGISPRLISSRDAAFCINSYPIFPLDCAKAFYRASQLNHFNYNTFDVHKHDQLAKLEHGDVSWIVPGKFIAFSGPVAQRREVAPGVYALSPEAYVPLFHSLGVTCVIRFNKKCYDRSIFTRGGIRHLDLFYEDGGNPSDDILHSFIRTCENETGAIAVHCKAGLGRTGTNIAAYMMKHYGYTAREATAWCRVCRPGSVVGPQQQYLETKQDELWAEGRRYRQDGGTGLQIHRRPRLSAGKQRSSTSSSSKKKKNQKTFSTIDDSVTARLLQRMLDDTKGAISNGVSHSENKSAKSSRTLSSTTAGRLQTSSPQRPSTTENTSRNSSSAGGIQIQSEIKTSDSKRDSTRKNSRGSIGNSSSSNGSTHTTQSQGSTSSNRRTVTSERRPNTSSGVATQRSMLKSSGSGSSSSLRSGGGLKNLNGNDQSRVQGGRTSTSITRVATRTRARTSTR